MYKKKHKNINNMAVKLLNQKKVLIIAEACDNHFGKLNNANK